MSTEPRNAEITRAVAEMMDSLPETPEGKLFSMIGAITDYVNAKSAERRRLFSVEDAQTLASLDFDLEDRESWPTGMCEMCNPDLDLGGFECQDADADWRESALSALVYAAIAPEWAYIGSLATAILEHHKDAELVRKLAFALDMHNGELVTATMNACSELMPRIAAAMPARTPRELMRGILAEVEAERAARQAEEDIDE